jgi:hypothetical protein
VRPLPRLRALVIVVVFLAAVPAAAGAQSAPLGEVARKESERRKSAPPPAKAYTNKDLPASAVRESPVPAPAAAQAPPAAQGEAPAKPAAGERDEAWWRGRITELREQLRRNEVFQEALQSQLNALGVDILARDDPYQRAKLGEDRAKAAAEMARVTAEIAAGKKAIEDFEEEARRAGVPPGWLR